VLRPSRWFSKRYVSGSFTFEASYLITKTQLQAETNSLGRAKLDEMLNSITVDCKSVVERGHLGPACLATSVPSLELALLTPFAWAKGVGEVFDAAWKARVEKGVNVGVWPTPGKILLHQNI
jgi:hypothetical protein